MKLSRGIPMDKNIQCRIAYSFIFQITSKSIWSNSRSSSFMWRTHLRKTFERNTKLCSRDSVIFYMDSACFESAQARLVPSWVLNYLKTKLLNRSLNKDLWNKQNLSANYPHCTHFTKHQNSWKKIEKRSPTSRDWHSLPEILEFFIISVPTAWQIVDRFWTT